MNENDILDFDRVFEYQNKSMRDWDCHEVYGTGYMSAYGLDAESAAEAVNTILGWRAVNVYDDQGIFCGRYEFEQI